MTEGAHSAMMLFVHFKTPSLPGFLNRQYINMQKLMALCLLFHVDLNIHFSPDIYFQFQDHKYMSPETTGLLMIFVFLI